MEAELKRLSRRHFENVELSKPYRFDPQTLVYPYSDELAWLCTNYLRTPSRVLVDLFETDAQRLESLFEDTSKWMKQTEQTWFTDGMGISVRARDVADFPASRSQIQGTVKNAIIETAEHFNIELELIPENPDILVSVRGGKERLVVSIDLGGRSLHERGYRLHRVKAPIRENIAAQILILARWNPKTEILIDPMCGSGTFLIEGVSMARAMKLWTNENRPLLDKLDSFSQFSRELPPLFEDTQPLVVGNDLASRAVKCSKKNAHEAQVKGIRFQNTEFDEINTETVQELFEDDVDTSRGLIVCNPPYGARFETDTVELYKRMGKWFGQFGTGWKAAVIVANPEFDDFIPFKRTMKKPMANASLSAWLFLYDLGHPKQDEAPRYRRGRN